jgi:SOUL heme-binding protein
MGRVSMRFFLPQSVASAGAPAPADPRLHLVQVQSTTIAAERFSGVATPAARDHHAAILLGVPAKSSWKARGEVFQLSYGRP